MEKHPKQLHVRVSEEELVRARRLSDSLDMSLSDLIRTLVQIPAEKISDDSAHAIVIDTTSAARIAREMRRWGHQYNQAVHALNRLAYFLERGKADRIDAVEVLSDVSAKLKELDTSIRELASSASEIAGRDLVYR